VCGKHNRILFGAVKKKCYKTAVNNDRIRLKHVGAHGRIIIWHPFKPIFCKYPLFLFIPVMF
jgi:hypothetical protein